MNERKLYVCGGCHQFWSSEQEGVTCPSCGGAVYPVDLSYAEYAAFSDREKQQFKKNYLASHAVVPEPPVAKKKRPAGEDFWLKLLNLILNLLLAVFLVVGLLVMVLNWLDGYDFWEPLLAGLCVAAVGLVLVAAMKVFLGLARDVRAIRRKMEK